MLQSQPFLETGQEGRVEDLNRDIYARSFPDAPLEPNISMRSVPTKYARFPMVEMRTPAQVPISHLPTFNTELQFTPPVTKVGPVSGFGVDKESQLQNRFFALNKHGSGIQNQYVPGSGSDLYKARPLHTGVGPAQPYPSLFKPYSVPVKTAVPGFIEQMQMSNKPFHNFTQTQLRIDATL